VKRVELDPFLIGVERDQEWVEAAESQETEGRPCAAGVTGEGLKCVLHRGAAPLACSSSLGTRNMLSACW
jgi:hypothetical protein